MYNTIISTYSQYYYFLFIYNEINKIYFVNIALFFISFIIYFIQKDYITITKKSIQYMFMSYSLKLYYFLIENLIILQLETSVKKF